MEARLDGAHFSEATCAWLRDEGIEFSVSVPFERFPELKSLILQRARWRSIDEEWAWFECDWKPQKWNRGMRCLVYRRRVKTPRKGPIQLDLFEPIERHNEYKVVMTNKRGTPVTVLHFHNGRGSQEGIFAELKSHGSLDYIPTRREIGNRVYMLACVLAHTLGREMQMRATPPSRKTGRARPLPMGARAPRHLAQGCHSARRTTDSAARTADLDDVDRRCAYRRLPAPARSLAESSGLTRQPASRAGFATLGYSVVRFSSRSYDFALARYNPDGSLDTTFGVGGMVTTDFANSVEAATAISIQGDGRIIAAGVTRPTWGSQNEDFAVVRYNVDGSLDYAFAAGGIATTDFEQGSDGAAALAIQGDGKSVAAGSAYSISEGQDFALARYHGVATMVDELEGLVLYTQELVAAGTINQGLGQSLLTKLETAVQRLDRGNTTAAINQLNAYLCEVDALVQAAILTPQEAQPLYHLVLSIIAELSA
ncbi:MAG: hypothetical protein IPM29_26740 [Planctomycetes bacterium]|nr:hypothetical protein [Planctomycetota bacterium]